MFIDLDVTKLLNQLNSIKRNKAIITLDNKLFQHEDIKKSTFPSINFTSTSRALMALSKKQKFDDQINFLYSKTKYQLIAKKQQLGSLNPNNKLQAQKNRLPQQHNNAIKLNKTLSFSKNFERTKYNASSLSKFKTKMLPKFEQQQKQQNLIKMQNKQQNLAPLNGQVKYSDKRFGPIEGYAVSSHIGKLNLPNNTRICIATNLLANYNHDKQISFFGIYEGRNGPHRAQYMRQNFHNMLINDQLFNYNFQKAVTRTLQKINTDFNYNPKYDGDYSVVKSVICVIIGTKMYVIRWGTPNAVISMNFGSYIKSLYFESKQDKIKQYKYKYRSSVGGSLASLTTRTFIPQESVHIRAFQLNSSFDFIMLTNEGLQQTFNSKNQLGRIFWKLMIDQSIHTDGFNRLAKASVKVCEQAALTDSLGRSTSMVVIQFKNMTSCFENSTQLDLPYSSKDLNLSSQNLFNNVSKQQQKDYKIPTNNI